MDTATYDQFLSSSQILMLIHSEECLSLCCYSKSAGIGSIRLKSVFTFGGSICSGDQYIRERAIGFSAQRGGTQSLLWGTTGFNIGLKRCGKSCRLTWLNYLRPNIKHGGFTEEEDRMILLLYRSIWSRWSVIASQLSGRTDNDVKNYWNTKLKRKLLAITPRSPTTVSATATASFTGNNFANFDEPTRPLDTLYANFPVDATNILPYYPMETNQEMLLSQLPLPGMVDVAGNPSNNNGGLLIPAGDPLYYEEAISSFSPPFSWSSSEESSFLAELLPYSLLNAVEFHETLGHFTCIGSMNNFASIFH